MRGPATAGAAPCVSWPFTGPVELGRRQKVDLSRLLVIGDGVSGSLWGLWSSIIWVVSAPELRMRSLLRWWWVGGAGGGTLTKLSRSWLAASESRCL
jgi:hypothetical protein